MPLRYIRLPSWHPPSPTPSYPSYALATRLQTKLQRELLAWKAASPTTRRPPPPPTLLAFTPTPTYTLGRRQRRRARAPARPASHPFPSPSPSTSPEASEAATSSASWFSPAVARAPRGGLTTYHGPGQLVLWPVIDLRSPAHAHFSVRDYACLLERTTIAALAAREGVRGSTTEENPGVWVRCRNGNGKEGVEVEERKIAALGVHLGRHVTGLGVAINYATAVSGAEDANPWARIVACGLGDKGVTSVRAVQDEQQAARGGEEEEMRGKVGNIRRSPLADEAAMALLAESWAREFAGRLGMRDSDGTGDVRAEELGEGWEREWGLDGDGEGGGTA